MSKIFVSHSSHNNVETKLLHVWLESQGWNDFFIDFDKTQGIKAGTQWRNEIANGIKAAEAVLVLLSPEWLASDWCRTEFYLANTQHKPILACIIKAIPISDALALMPEWQIVDLTKEPHDLRLSADLDGRMETRDFSRHATEKLRHGLEEIGIKANYFGWPPQGSPHRSPYPGLAPVQEDEAGVYFGRDGSIASALSLLREINGRGTSKIVAILGASGAGKSSFLRAGIVPRVKRDRRHFAVLPTIRPGNFPITGDTGLVDTLLHALRSEGKAVSRHDVRKAIDDGPSGIWQMLAAIATDDEALSRDSDTPRSLVVTVDQAEELVSLTANSEASEFLKIIGELVTAPAEEGRPCLIVVVTIRTDSYEHLQLTPQLKDLPQELFSLSAMPIGEYGNIIRGPARRQTESGRKLQVDEQLVHALLEDIQAGGAKDSLPLLSFTLQRLYREFGDSGEITLPHYIKLGRIRGSIEAAIERVLVKATDDPRLPSDRAAQFVLLRRGLIPWLASIDPETNSPRRRVARLSEIPTEAQPLMKIMVEERLLAVDRDPVTREETIEPAHEALLRQWGDLDKWLQENLGDYSAIYGVKRQARDWASSGKNKEWLSHTGLRLLEAQRSRNNEDFARLLEPTDVEYLNRCQEAETAREQRKFRTLKQFLAAAICCLVVVAIFAAFSWVQYSKANEARLAASASLSLAKSADAQREAHSEAAALLALNAVGSKNDAIGRSQLFTSGSAISPNLDFIYHFAGEAPVSLVWDGGELISLSREGTVQRFVKVGRPTVVSVDSAKPPSDGTDRSSIAAFSTSQGLLTIFRDGQVTALDGDLTAYAEGGPTGVTLQGRGSIVSASREGNVLAAVHSDGVTIWQCTHTPEPRLNCVTKTIDDDNSTAVALSASGTKLAVGHENGVISVISTADLKTIFSYRIPEPLVALDWSHDESLLATASNSNSIRVIGVSGLQAGKTLLDEKGSGVGTPLVAWSPTSAQLAYICDAVTICVRSAATTEDRTAALRLIGHTSTIVAVAWDSEGLRLASASVDGELRGWFSRQDKSVQQFLELGSSSLTSLEISTGARSIAIGSSDGQIYFGNDGSLSALPVKWPASRVSRIAFSRAGQMAAVVDGCGLVLLHRPGEQVIYTAIDNAGEMHEATWIDEHSIALMAIGGRVGLLPAGGGQLQLINDGALDSTPWGSAWDPKSRTLLASYTDGSLRRIDPESGLAVMAVKTPDSNVTSLGVSSLAISPDSRLLAYSDSSGDVLIKNTSDDKSAERLATGSPTPKTVRFSPNGKRLAALSSDGRITVWNKDDQFRTDFQIRPIFRGSGTASAMDWRDDETLAIGSTIGEFRLQSTDLNHWAARIRSIWRYAETDPTLGD